MPEQSAVAALIPVKAFSAGKTRLRDAFDDDARAAFAEKLATAVVQACAPLAPHVVCEDAGVAAWAEGHGASVIWAPGSGLNRVVRYGVAALAEAGFERVMVVHADLAEPQNLPALAERDGVVIVPDLAMEGTNVLLVPSGAGFRFSYGPNSFARHLSEAERLGVEVHVVRDDGLGLDLDEPSDLAAYDRTDPAAG